MIDIYKAELTDEGVAASHEELYALYDRLTQKYPEYVSMNVLGMDDWGNELREYVFSTPNFNSRKDAPRTIAKEIQKPVLLVTSGVHGEEKTSVAGGYLFLKELAESKGPDCMAALREAICIKMIPCVVPSGYSNCDRASAAGVNMNRNFYTGWYPAGTPEDKNYSGSLPGSEKETKAVQKWMEQNDNAFYYLDLHNTGNVDTDVTWIAIMNQAPYRDELLKNYSACLNSLARHWRQDHGLPPDRNLGYSGRIMTIACAARYADYLGIPSIILESSWQQKYTTDTERFGPVTNAISAEFFGNMVLRLAKEYL